MIHVVVFGSFMGGYHVLKELLSGELAKRIQVTGVATDDPTQPFTHADVRTISGLATSENRRFLTVDWRAMPQSPF